MPIYEYACKNCGHTLDALQKMSDDSLVDCPECGESKLKRLISAPRFRLKGQGWYETDFKKDNQRNLSTGDVETSKSSNKEAKPTGRKESTDSKSKSASAGSKPADTKKAPAKKNSD